MFCRNDKVPLGQTVEAIVSWGGREMWEKLGFAAAVLRFSFDWIIQYVETMNGFLLDEGGEGDEVEDGGWEEKEVEGCGGREGRIGFEFEAVLDLVEWMKVWRAKAGWCYGCM